ncbi:MAG: DUF971 domain-containing protein [Acidimicrobiales bacterium]|nr:DUF971 domain-containing protein [Acidimicrobiales bacterium]
MSTTTSLSDAGSAPVGARSSSVTLSFPGRPPVQVNALWLRDNCPCQSCRIEATTEHRTLISQTPVDLIPVRLTNHDDGIRVDWGTHQSEYSAGWLDDVRSQAQRDLPLAQAWPQGFTPPRFGYADIMRDPDVELAFLDAFGSFGAAIATGTPTEPGSLEPFIDRWAPPHEVPFDRIHDVYVNPVGYNVAHTAEALPPHNDMASRIQPPSGQILHMLVNDATGGDTILVDGFAVVANLSEAHRALLASVPVAFRQFSTTSETWARSPLLRMDRNGNPVHLRYSNQLLQALDPLDLDTGPWYEAYHQLSTLLTDRSNQSHFRLNGGDLLMVYGHRVLHGRTEFSPASGERHLQDIYFEFDDVMNEAYRLRHLAGPAQRRNR